MKGKYEAQNTASQKPIKKKKKPIGLFVVVAVLLAAVVAIVVLGGLGKNPLDLLGSGKNSGTNAGNEMQELNDFTGKMGALFQGIQFESTYLDLIQHEEVTDGDVIMEVFYMVRDNGEMDLFRICFTDQPIGTPICKVRLDDQIIPVNVVTASHVQEDFNGEEEYNTYCMLMEQVNVVVDWILTSDFVVADELQEGERTTAALQLWTVELPQSITWEESGSGNTYRVDFFGTVGDKKILLYTVSLDSAVQGNVLGTYELDSGKTPVYIQTYSLDDQGEGFDEFAYTEYATLMETINDVVQVIMSDAKFSQKVS